MNTTRGFTMLETMFVVAIFTIIMGVTFTMAISFGDTADVQNAKVSATDAAQQGFLTILPELRQAARSSINFTALPANKITYRMPVDTDGNGTAVDATGKIELGVNVTVGPDTSDANKDGKTITQLIRKTDSSVVVIANGLAADAAASGTTPAVQGVWFQASGNGILASITTEGKDRKGHKYRTTFTQTIMPRN